MIESVKSLTGRTLHATDDSFGSCRDLYFEDGSLGVLYLVADTRKWLPGRKTLLSPQIVKSVDADAIRFDVKRDQIEDSPPVEERLPVSRQLEQELFSHYGWSPYWGLPALNDPSAGPGALAPAPRYQREQSLSQQDEPNLRSAAEVIGYKVQASGDRVGKVHDLLIDTSDWTLRYIAVDTHPWIPGGIHVVDASSINGIDGQSGLLDLRCLAQEIKTGPAFSELELPCETESIEHSRLAAGA